MPFVLSFGSGSTAIFSAGLPVLAGAASESLFSRAQPDGRIGSLSLFRQDEWLLGAATVRSEGDLEGVSRQIYRDIFRGSRGFNLVRIWNYVPAINEHGPGDLENYRLFCRGRSVAFEECYGSGFTSLLPAASAVGCTADALTVIFAAHTKAARHLENPLQIPAYEYPTEYGPRAPSFARATVVPGSDRRVVFISGTAAIRGHATVAPDHLGPQLECALENLRELSQACGLGSDLDRAKGSQRHFKVYLRRAADLPVVAARLEREWLNPTDQVSYLRADICRKALLVEIEATVYAGAPARS